MRHQNLVVVFTVLLVNLCLALAWPISENIKENVRWKRQSHPEATVAILGQVGSGGEAVAEEPLPYLIPPKAEGRAAGGGEGRWELGFEAGDILVPPLPDAHPGPYETMREKPDLEPAQADPLPAASGPLPSGVFTFVQTDREGHFKWGVRHDPV